MQMVRVSCRTNLDDYNNERWPEQLLPTIKKGDWVKSKSGRVLKVVQITHRCVPMVEGFEENTVYTHFPIVLEIELHKI